MAYRWTRALAVLIGVAIAAFAATGCAEEPSEDYTLEEVVENEELVGRRVTLIAPLVELPAPGAVVLAKDDARLLVVLEPEAGEPPGLGRPVQVTGTVEEADGDPVPGLADAILESSERRYMRAQSIEAVPESE